jgi:Zn-dependent protease with chaperone function
MESVRKGDKLQAWVPQLGLDLGAGERRGRVIHQTGVFFAADKSTPVLFQREGTMRGKHYRGTRELVAGVALVSVFLVPLSIFAQTKISYHNNKYKTSDDLKLGRQAAAEVEKQLPLLHDQLAGDYVSRVGQRLVAAIPPEFQHPEFEYYFKIVNASDINAFALPGGPMFVNRGMIEAARTEGEMAGVMAHELSHVALRHGTAQATKAQKYSVLAGVLGIGGTIVGGPALGQLAAAPVGVYFLKFSREYETEADVLGAQIMARAGYDPHDLANMFKTIERTSGGGGGGFLSDHPGPENRYARINQEADSLTVENPIRDSRDFERVQARLHTYPKAPSTEQIMRGGQRYPSANGNYPDEGRDPNDRRNSDDRRANNSSLGRVSPPSSRYETYSELGFLRVKVPDNWREIRDNDSVWFAPEGGYGQVNGQPVFTHGINFSVAQSQGQSLRAANDQMVEGLLRGSPNMRQLGRSTGTNAGTRYWMRTEFTNVNEATGRTENIALATTQLRNGNVLFISTVLPQNDSGLFQNAFASILTSLQLNN